MHKNTLEKTNEKQQTGEHKKVKLKESTKKILNVSFIVLTLGIMLFIVLKNNEMSDIISVLESIKVKWVLGCLFCLLAYYTTGSLGTYLYLRKEKNRITFFSALKTAIIGAYYSNITPGASGGQPMQVYHLNKKGVSVGVGSSALSVKLFFTQLGVVLGALALWVFNRDFFNQQVGHVRGLIILGIVINFSIIPILILVMVNEKWVKKAFMGLVKLGTKLRIIKNRENAQVKVEKALDRFHKSAMETFSNIGNILVQGICGALQMFFYMCIAVCTYKAFGLSATPWYQVLLISYLVFISASYMPTPAGAGAQEGGFYLFYKGIFPENQIGLALLLWRFFTLYLTLIIGTVVIVFSGFQSKKEARESTGEFAGGAALEDEEEAGKDLPQKSA